VFGVADSPDEYKTKLRAIAEAVKTDSNAYIEEITVNTGAGTVKRVVWINGEKKKDTGDQPTGTETDFTAADGRPAKVRFAAELRREF
jgi:hypothetical protein